MVKGKPYSVSVRSRVSGEKTEQFYVISSLPKEVVEMNVYNAQGGDVYSSIIPLDLEGDVCWADRDFYVM